MFKDKWFCAKGASAPATMTNQINYMMTKETEKFWAARKANSDAYLAEINKTYPRRSGELVNDQFFHLLESVAAYPTASERSHHIENLIQDLNGVIEGTNEVVAKYYQSWSQADLALLLAEIEKEKERLTVQSVAEQEIATTNKKFEERKLIESLGDKILDENPGDENHPYVLLDGAKRYINFYGFKVGDEINHEGKRMMVYGSVSNMWGYGLKVVSPELYAELEEQGDRLLELKKTDPSTFAKQSIAYYKLEETEKTVIFQDELKALQQASENT